MRRAGILLDVRSLPHSGTPGSLRTAACAWIDLLAESGIGLWQILPLNPVDAVGSPYASPSSSAIDPRLHHALASDMRASGIETMRALEEQPWLDLHATFYALRDMHGTPWASWPNAIRSSTPRSEDIDADRRRHHARVQVELEGAWREIHAHARSRGVTLIGDIPLYVAWDSAEVWADPDLFHLTPDGHPEKRAGVPPDAFSATGQLWGNPIYRWEAHERSGFAWWKARIERLRDLVDVIRIDHFIGMVRAWSVPKEAEDARIGTWLEPPGEALMAHLIELDIDFIAEDLGLVTDHVINLRQQHGLMGMAVHQFGFDHAPNAPHSPAMTPEDVVAYSGTHDNDTTNGWWASTSDDVRKGATEAGVDPADPARSLVRLGLQSDARWYIAPLQDLLGLGSEARLNTPSTTGPQNWSWRASPHHVDRDAIAWYGAAVADSGRV